MTLPFLESASFWSNVAVVIFTILAAIAGVFALYFSSRLSAVKDADLDRFKTESAQVVASADARAADALKEAARANELAEREGLERARLEAQIAPRRLTGDQKATLTGLLQTHRGAVAIVSALLDSEGGDFADDFDSAFRAAHWETMRIRNRISNKYEVSVATLEGTAHEGVKILSDALTAIGIEHETTIISPDESRSTSPAFESRVVYLVVEHKPPRTTGTQKMVKK